MPDRSRSATARTPWWFTEVYAKFERAGGESAHFDAVEWENKFQLTELGEYPVDVGKWDDWDPAHAQSHIAGPAVFGNVRLGGRQALVWNAGYLFKVSGSAPDHTLRAQVEFEF